MVIIDNTNYTYYNTTTADPYPYYYATPVWESGTVIENEHFYIVGGMHVKIIIRKL